MKLFTGTNTKSLVRPYWLVTPPPVPGMDALDHAHELSSKTIHAGL